MKRNLTTALTTAAVGMMAGAAVYMLGERPQPRQSIGEVKRAASKALSGAGDLMDDLSDRMMMR